MILAGDVGGTKSLLALCDDTGKIQRDAIFSCADYGSFEAVIDAFLPERPPLAGACFGVAGPVVDGVAKITNLPWTIDARVLGEKLGAPVAVINDLQATALGTLVLPPEAFVSLQAPVDPPKNGTIAVIAPGTGLGESLLVHNGARYMALPTEAGHADFAPGTDEEIALLRFLREKYDGHVSYERVLSGNGIGDLYSFARTKSGIAEPEWLAQQMASGDRNAVIAEAALAKSDAVCVHALELFAEILGAEAGNFALRGLAAGGVTIGGGIPPKILPMLTKHVVSGVQRLPLPLPTEYAEAVRGHARPFGSLIERFNDKGRFGIWTRLLGVRVVLEPRAALFGAIHYVVTSKDSRS